MAPLPANDVYTWIPPTPAGVLAEAGFNSPSANNAGTFAPHYTEGWNVQTYLGLGTAGIVQTYSAKAPELPPEEPEDKPKPRSKARSK